MRAYQGGKEAARAVTIEAAIVDARGSTVFRSDETLGPDRFAASRTAEFRLDLPLGRLGAGPHALMVDATLGKDVVRRAARFTVR